ncbi:MAG: TetR/AcrR family transcriptional regulator [Solirubrobacteraceae bacterium]
MPRAERETLILGVAGREFARRGYHAASMDEIARGAGVSKPMVYTYFGSKEALYVAYINRTGSELVQRLLAAVGDEVPSMVRLHRRVEAFLRFVEEHRDGWTVLFTEASSSRPVADEVAVLRSEIAEAVRRLVEDGMSPSALPPLAADAVAHAIVGAGESLANWWLAHPAVSLDEVANWYAGVIAAAFSAVVRKPGGARPFSGN